MASLGTPLRKSSQGVFAKKGTRVAGADYMLRYSVHGALLEIAKIVADASRLLLKM